MLTPEREAYIRKWNEFEPEIQELLAEIDRLREVSENWQKACLQETRDASDGRMKLALAVKALEEIKEHGIAAHRIGKGDAHSFHLGMCLGIVSGVLNKLRGKE